MLPYWDTVIEPLLVALNEGPVVEIGAASGDTTVRLAELAAERGFDYHAVDPEPQFDAAELERRFANHFHFHQARSHDALEEIGAAAAVLIDGDHNWYTVHGELTRLESIAAAHNRTFPLVILHDVEWPYARRDMYYEPEAIPERSRQPCARRGIRWGQSALAEDGAGVNSHLANAIEEGGPRNGVLTAIEDFINGSKAQPELRIVRGGAGLGILATPKLLAIRPSLQQQWDRLHSADFLLEHTKALSEASARTAAAQIQAANAAKQLRRELAEAREQLKALEQRTPA